MCVISEEFFQLPRVVRERYTVELIARINIPMVKAGQGSCVIITLKSGLKDVWEFQNGWKLKKTL